MTREIRITFGTTGTLLLVSAFVLLFIPPLSLWPWVLLFVSVGGGLVTGSIMSQNAELDREAAERRAQSSTLP